MIIAPSEEQVQQTNRFRTYLNYLSSFLDFFGMERYNPEIYVKPVIESKAFQDIQGGRCPDIEKVGRILRNAWFTELQLSISGQNEEFIFYSNHWAPVQLYYSAYLGLRAYFIVSGQAVSNEHASNLKAIGEEIQRRPSLFPLPLKVICVGNPEDNTTRYLNLPQHCSVSKISPLSSSWRVSFWDSYGMFLRTTRIRQLEKLCDDWRSLNKRKRISPKVKKAYSANLSPTTLFHCLYRLRVRSNYADADSFLLSVQETEEAIRFHNALQTVGWFALLVLELLIARYIGKKKFEQFVNDFRKHETQGLSDELICFRWDHLRNLW